MRTREWVRWRWVQFMLLAALALFQAGVVWRAVQRVGDPVGVGGPPPLWEAVAALLWCAAVITIIGREWRGLGQGRHPVLPLFIGFSIYSLFRLFLFSQADYDRGRLPFLTLLIVLCALVATLSNWRANRTSNGVSSHDREPQH